MDHPFRFLNLCLMSPKWFILSIMDVERTERLLRTMLASAEGFQCLAHGAGGVGESVEGVLCWRSQSRVPLFNGAAITSGAQLNSDTLDGLFRYFTTRAPHQKYSVLTLDNLTPGALRQLSHYGYKEYEHFPAMWLELDQLAPPQRSALSTLQISRVEDLQALGQFREVLRQTFKMPRDEVELVLSDKALSVPNSRHYLGAVGGEAVATATLVLDGEVAGVWNVGTLPEWERKGIGGALMRHILSDAADMGYGASMLLASAVGVPFYERLGYVTLDTMRVSVPDLEHESW